MSKQSILGPATLFYAYSHEDEALRQQLEHHLSLLQRQGLLLPWHDRLIGAGEDWKHAINEHLEVASIILLLISPAFLASDYCYDHEMTRALDRQQAGQARVIPILLRPCDWHTAPFGHLQALPRDGRAITTWTNQDEAFLQVSRSLRALLAQPIPVSKTRGTATQNRANMLIKLQRMYDEVLDDSLQKLAWIDLPLTSQPGAVHTTANLLLRRTNLPAEPLPSGTTIQQVYQQANQELLILGEPGAGKSTLLCQLGRDLLTPAHDTGQPLPVVFPLASWTQKRLPLQEWMVEQLSSSLYEVPRRQSQQWIVNQQILPLLDGLDEMAAEDRPACIAAINAYHAEASLCPLVVCSRSQEYQEAARHERLHLSSAVEVRPLTWEQQEAALRQTGAAIAELQVELSANQELRSLASNPLWLSLLVVTLREISVCSLPQERSALQLEVLQQYVQRMCQRKGNVARYPLVQTTHWLGFLANQMRQRNRVVFAIEELQPDWLPRLAQSIYSWSVGPLIGLLVGLVGGPLVGLVGGPPGEWVGGPLLGLIGGLLFNLLIGLDGYVKLTERLTWSWGGAGWGLVIGLPIGLVEFLLIDTRDALVYRLLNVLVSMLSLGVIVGVESKQIIDEFSFPGQGLSRSMRKGLLVALLVGLLGGLFVGLFSEQFVGPLGGLLVGLDGGLLIGLLIGLFSGLEHVFQHLLLRFWLSRLNGLPWQLIAFLNDASERALLKRVGGTYRFIHQIVLDYFADQESHNAHTSIDLATTNMSDHSVQRQSSNIMPQKGEDLSS